MGIYNELKEHLEKRLKKYKIDEKCGGADYAKEGYDYPIYV